MRITRFTAENFKRLKAVDITPDANTVVIKGRNAQGKSSVLDGIMAALAGRAGAKELVRPVRDGETKARVAVELDDLVVERRWSPSGSTVTVSPKGGNARLNSPQKVLDELIGSLSFDPLAFAEADPKKQVDTLIDLIGREEFEDIAARRREAYDERTEVNRDIKSLRSQIDGLGPDIDEVEPVDVSRLSIELEAAIEVERARADWDALEVQINNLRSRQDALSKAAQDVIDKVAPRDSAVVREEMGRVTQINEAAERWRRYLHLREGLDVTSTRANDLSNMIYELDEKRADLIRSADLPVEGLSFDDDGVAYHGVPFVQASAAERLKVSVAMAMALNPDLRVICIRDASLLDDDSKRALVDMAVEHDFQIWYEVVGTDGEVGVVIEDGEVAS